MRWTGLHDGCHSNRTGLEVPHLAKVAVPTKGMTRIERPDAVMDPAKVHRSPYDMFTWMEPATQSAFLAAVHLRRCAAAQVIYLEGDHGTEMFRVASGGVRLSCDTPDGRQLILLQLGEGDCFGGSSLVDGGSRPQTAEAIGSTVLQVLPRDGYDRLMAEQPSFGRAMLQLLAKQMRAAAAHYANRNLDRIATRVASRLLLLADDGAARVSSPPIVRISQSELASMVGASRQHVNRALRRLQSLAMISIGYNQIEIVDPAAMTALMQQCHLGDRGAFKRSA
jgi:CRP/FNR family cyclic AMP-dependent transcriptional regulator